MKMNHGVKYGLLTAIASILYIVVLHFAGQITNNLLMALALLLLIGGIILAHLSYKKANQGEMSYGKGLLIGTILSLVAAIVTRIYLYIHIKFIDTELLDYYAETQSMAFEQRGMDPEQIDAVISGPMFSAEGFVLMGLAFYFIVGVILSLIIAAITKKKA
jgi:hypothetical protein